MTAAIGRPPVATSYSSLPPQTLWDKASRTPADSKIRRSLGATIVPTAPEYRSIVAWMPLAKIKQLAADPEVVAIQPAPEGTTVK
jgi:hypothetical protein